MDSMAKFDKLVGLLFGKLYEEFPVPIELTPELFLEAMLDEADADGSFDFSEYFGSTIKWLETAGYIWIEHDKCSSSGIAYDIVLSERGLEALRRIPESLEGNASIGERLMNFSKSKASDAVNTLISLAISSAVSSGIP